MLPNQTSLPQIPEAAQHSFGVAQQSSEQLYTFPKSARFPKLRRFLLAFKIPFSHDLKTPLCFEIQDKIRVILEFLRQLDKREKRFQLKMVEDVFLGQKDALMEGSASPFWPCLLTLTDEFQFSAVHQLSFDCCGQLLECDILSHGFRGNQQGRDFTRAIGSQAYDYYSQSHSLRPKIQAEVQPEVQPEEFKLAESPNEYEDFSSGSDGYESPEEFVLEGIESSERLRALKQKAQHLQDEISDNLRLTRTTLLSCETTDKLIQIHRDFLKELKNEAHIHEKEGEEAIQQMELWDF